MEQASHPVQGEEGVQRKRKRKRSDHEHEENREETASTLIDEPSSEKKSKKKHKKKHKKRKGDDGVVHSRSEIPASHQDESEQPQLGSEVSADTIEYPYEVQPDDHCETPLEAYADVAFVLNYLAQQLLKKPSELFIYDPYYCEGSMVERLGSLGFTHVYNRKEDFYAMQAAGLIPEYDVLVTNPPYSEDHMERLVRFCTASSKPFLLLVPNYVYTKDYFMRIPGTNRMFYIAPAQGRRYQYTTPKGRRQKKSAKFTSPFPTFWYCSLGAHKSLSAELVQTARQQTNIVLAQSARDIPLHVAPDNDPRKKKLRNAEKRKKHKARKKGQQASS